jgi:hypothetical protein
VTFEVGTRGFEMQISQEVIDVVEAKDPSTPSTPLVLLGRRDSTAVVAECDRSCGPISTKVFEPRSERIQSFGL